jgi:hypothetical protein
MIMNSRYCELLSMDEVQVSSHGIAGEKCFAGHVARALMGSGYGVNLLRSVYPIRDCLEDRAGVPHQVGSSHRYGAVI